MLAEQLAAKLSCWFEPQLDRFVEVVDDGDRGRFGVPRVGIDADPRGLGFESEVAVGICLPYQMLVRFAIEGRDLNDSFVQTDSDAAWQNQSSK